MNQTTYGLCFRHYLRRLGRGFFGPLIFVVLPVVITILLNFIYSQRVTEEIYVYGNNMIATHIALGMMILFQLNSGIYLLNYLNSDLFQPMRWRLKAAPCATTTLLFAAIGACMVFTVLQGILIITGTAWLTAAYWGNFWVALLVVVLLSLISQLLNMILFFLTGNLGTTEGLSWFISWAMGMLSGLYFPLPNKGFFQFVQNYGTPFALAQTAIKGSGFLRSSPVAVGVSLAALLGTVLVLAVIAIALGRREF